jgi:hypothetical protein
MSGFKNTDSAIASESYELVNRGKHLDDLQDDLQDERSRAESIEIRDTADLARLGKKQVLKVRCEHPRNRANKILTSISGISRSYQY